MSNPPGSISISNSAGDGIYNEAGSTFQSSITMTVANSGGTGVLNLGTLSNSGTVDFECGGNAYGPITGSSLMVRGSGCPPTLMIETRTSSGMGIQTLVSISGTNAPTSVSTDSSGNYLFPAGVLVQGDTYTVSAVIDGATLSASVVLGGNSVIVLEPTPPVLPAPEFPFGVLMALLASIFALVSYMAIRMKQRVS